MTLEVKIRYLFDHFFTESALRNYRGTVTAVLDRRRGTLEILTGHPAGVTFCECYRFRLDQLERLDPAWIPAVASRAMDCADGDAEWN